VQRAEAYLIYKKSRQSSYTEESIVMAEGENVTYSFKRGDLADKTLYVVAKSLSPNASDVSFETVRIDIPSVLPDNSDVARISFIVLLTSLGLIVSIKTFEIVEASIKRKELL
jgi:hypothetical protein